MREKHSSPKTQFTSLNLKGEEWKMNRATQAINAQLKLWSNIKPYDINDGLCEDFALAVVEKCKGAIDVCTENYVDFGMLPGHVWIIYRMKHYDAECPEGVNNWRELPIFKRALNQKVK